MLIFAETVFDMTHLIDAERLKTFVQARRDMHYNHYVTIGVGCIAECKYEEDVELLDLIESLQQEQPEVDLERELRDYFSKWDYDSYDGVITMDNGIVATLSSIQNVARYFWNKGYNARKEE